MTNLGPDFFRRRVDFRAPHLLAPNCQAMWGTMLREAKAVDFLLEDATGRALVRAQWVHTSRSSRLITTARSLLEPIHQLVQAVDEGDPDEPLSRALGQAGVA